MSPRKVRKNTGEAWRFMTRLLWRAELELQETKMVFNAASCLQACITKLTSVNLICPAPARQPNEQAHQRQDKGFKTCGEICTGSEQRTTTVHDCKKQVADCDCNQEKLFVSWIPAKPFEFQFLFWTSGLQMAKVHEAATKSQMSQNDAKWLFRLWKFKRCVHLCPSKCSVTGWYHSLHQQICQLCYRSMPQNLSGAVFHAKSCIRGCVCQSVLKSSGNWISDKKKLQLRTFGEVAMKPSP